MAIVLNIIGIALLLGGLYLVSPNKKDVNKKMILKALGIQVVLAFLLLKFPLGRMGIEKISDVVTKVLSYGAQGLGFVFGPLADAYPPRTVADILPIPDIRTNIISLSVMPDKYLLTSIGDSVCPKNIFTTATKLSTLLVPSTFSIAPPISLTTKPISPI